MDYTGPDYQAKQIKKYQKFLLKLLHIRIGNYYPLRKYLGIDYKGKIDEITNLSIAYNAKKVKKGYQVTRTYQGKDLGYKLNLLLDKIPQLALLPALLQPAYGCLALAFFFLTQTTYQPSTKDTYLRTDNPDTNYGAVSDYLICYGRNSTTHMNILQDFDISDIPSGATFSQGDVSMYHVDNWGYARAHDIYVNRITQLGWTEGGATWNKYDGTNAWTTAGGDYTTTNRVYITIGANDGAMWKTWSAINLVQDCYDNQSKHVNVLFFNSNEDGNEKASRFRPREYTGDTSLRPKLTVTYTVSTSYNATVLALTTAQQTPTITFPVEALLSSLGLALTQQTPFQNYDYRYNIAVQALSLLQKTPTQNYDYLLTVLSQGLILEQPITIEEILSYVYPSVLALSLLQQTPTQNFDYQLSVLVQALSLSQQNPTINYDYLLTVLSQGLILGQPITIEEILSYVYPSVLALSLAQKDPTYNSSYTLSSLGLTLSQPTPTYNFSYALSSLGLLLSQHNPWYFLWSKEKTSTTIWHKEIVHN